MMNFYDIAYGIGLSVSAPYWLIKTSARRKVLTALKQRMGRDLPAIGSGGAGVIMIHAVSLGEMNATRALVQRLREERPGLQFVISSTTETGHSRGLELYGPANDVQVIWYPLDFSGAVERVLDHVRPDVVVLMELEVWPNFVKRCSEREIPVVLANARLTASSFRNYKLGKILLKPTFNRLTLVGAQEVTYAHRFLALGVQPHRVVITGTMKFDNATMTGPGPLAVHNARAVGLRLGQELIWVCGSTGPGEEEIILRIYRRLLARFPRLRLVIVPRHPQRFDEVDQIIADAKLQCVRLSWLDTDPPPANPVLPPVILVDAMGVLRDFYSVANIVFVGRSLVDLGPRQHGSDMIEPAALGKPVIVGPYTGNFAEVMNRFRQSDAMMEVKDEADLEQVMGVLLSTPREAAALAQRGLLVVRNEQGATTRHALVILQIMSSPRGEMGGEADGEMGGAFESLRPASPAADAPQYVRQVAPLPQQPATRNTPAPTAPPAAPAMPTLRYDIPPKQPPSQQPPPPPAMPTAPKTKPRITIFTDDRPS